MEPKQGITSEDFLGDLKRGLSDEELMDTYKLTERGLGTVFRRLVDDKVISFSELLRRSPDRNDLPELVAEFRLSTRHSLGFPLPIYDSAGPENKGLVYDISEDGLGTRGLTALTDEIKTLVIPADEFFQAGPVIFQGMCTWIDEQEVDNPPAAGFRVVEVLKGSLKEVQALVHTLLWIVRHHETTLGQAVLFFVLSSMCCSRQPKPSE